MGKLRVTLLVVLGIALLALAGYFLVGNLNPKEAGLLIETNPTSAVFIDGVQVGRTPFETTLKPKEVVVKLVPDALSEPLATFETRVNLTGGIKTVIKREFGSSEDTSAGEIISFEKTGESEAVISVVSVPSDAEVVVDGLKKGFAPVKVSVAPGAHQLVVERSGYSQRTLNINALAGFKVTVVVKLASLPMEEQDEQGEVEEAKVMIEISETPTGFLRVREEASASSKEVAQVSPGDTFVLIEEDSAAGWYKIEYEPQKEGWVSAEYSKKKEESTP